MPQPGSRVFERFPVFVVKPTMLNALVVGVCGALAALAIRYVIGLFDPLATPFLAFLVATIFAAILAGPFAGMICAALGLAAVWFGFQPLVPESFAWIEAIQYLVFAALIIWIAAEYRWLLRRVQEREKVTARQLRLIEAENQTLTLIAADGPLKETLTSLVLTIEQYCEQKVFASVLLLDPDGQHLRHCAAPSLPDEYNSAIDGVKIGPGVGSCGTAAFEARPVYVENIETDPLWKDFRDLAYRSGLRACWSTPIMSRTNTVLGTFAIYHPQPQSPKAAELEIVALLVRIASLAIERERGREQTKLLMQELSHRVKNSLAVVSSIASNSLKAHLEKSIYEDFEQRLMALAQVQAMLTQTDWAGIGVLELLKNIATVPFASHEGRFHFEGPPTHLPNQLILPFALAIHELCTNAVKYGSLSVVTGTVEICWGIQPCGESEQFYFKWVEKDGPPVLEPTRKGFGSRMIKTAFAQSAGGDAVWRYLPDGLECEIHLPMAAMTNSESDLNKN